MSLGKFDLSQKTNAEQNAEARKTGGEIGKKMSPRNLGVLSRKKFDDSSKIILTK